MRRGDKVGVQVLQRGYDRPEGWRVNVPVAAAAQPTPPHAGTADRCTACDENETDGEMRDAASVRWMQYTDGSWEPPEEGGNQIREAGAGVAVFEMCAGNEPGAFPMGQLVNVCETESRRGHERARYALWAIGPCNTEERARVRGGDNLINPQEKEHIGATAHTNNTGEL